MSAYYTNQKKLTYVELFPSNLSFFSTGSDLKPTKTHKKKITPTNPEKPNQISGKRSRLQSPRLNWRELRRQPREAVRFPQL